MTKQRSRPHVARALLTSALIVVFAGPVIAGQHINLAGSFNNWSTSDDAYRMKKVGDRYECLRFWRCGSHTFKFTFNGTWNKHLGDAGGGRLSQPGDNISLAIQTSGEYAIWLDPSKRRWGIEKRKPSKPRAIFMARQISFNAIILDPTLSLVPEGRPLTYRWKVESEDLSPNDWQFVQVGAPARLHLSRPGILSITLTVESGDDRDQMTITRRFGDGCTLIPRSGRARGGLRMHRLGDDLWGAVYAASTSGEQRFHVKGHGLPLDERGRSLAMEAGRPSLVTYDAAADTLAIAKPKWHAFTLSVEDHPHLPANLVVERVDLIGDFNGWQAGTHTMLWGRDGRYETVLLLPDGVYHYKFLVNGGLYLDDPTADKRFRESDGGGGHNSGFRIGLDAAELGPTKPDHINVKALGHDPAEAGDFKPIGRNLVQLQVRTLAGDVESVRVVRTDGDTDCAMRVSRSAFGFDYWTALISTAKPTLSYRFLLRDGKDAVRLDADGVAADDGKAGTPFERRITMSFETPDWAKRAVWYQIFPERFRNGDKANDPPRTVPWRHAWYKPYKPGDGAAKGSPADFTETGEFEQFIYNRRYGGDLQGVLEKLPYLRDLGVTAIYFNPVFAAESLHKYDASDFRHIDDFFGVAGSLDAIKGETEDPATWQWSESDKLFLAFLKEAHRQGFKVIIDGVFNHVGRDFWAFRDVLEKGKDSPYAGWFDIKSFEPFHYAAWDRDDGSLPRLKHDDALGLCEPVREHLFAITRRWMDPNGDGDPSDGIDGWRLDVASDVNIHFWKDWRKVVKTTNPDAYIVAELWEKSPEWLDGRSFDAVMNYPFARATQRFFANQRKASKPSAFGRELEEALGFYVPQVNYVLQNLFGSHDTDRVASMFMNPDLEYDQANRQQDNGPNYNVAKPTPDCYRRLKAMVTFQMTYLGAPMMYYGDEVGMYGADDPSCRKPMLWDDLLPYADPEERIEQALLDHHRHMIAVRHTYPALQLGAYETLQADDRNRMFAFARTLDGESVVVVINNSDRPHRVNVPVTWPDGSKIVRLDDPASCERVPPAKDNPTGRPTVRPVKGHKTKLKVDEGRLHGATLPPKSAAVFARMAGD